MRFQGRVALVTGAGRAGGIGEAIALRLAREGACVAVVDLCRPNPAAPRERFGAWDELQAVAERVNSAGGTGFAIRADVTHEEEVAAMFAGVEERFGALHALFNNAAGGTGAGPVDRTPLVSLAKRDWDYTLAISLTSVFLCSRSAAPLIARSGGGSIVNTVSISAHHGVPGLSAYSAAKYAVIALTRTLALELAADGIRVNAFSPGMTATPYVRQRFEAVAREHPELTPEEHMLQRAKTMIPLGRAAEPEEMASVAAFLASDDASYMTGQIVCADGGMRV